MTLGPVMPRLASVLMFDTSSLMRIEVAFMMNGVQDTDVPGDVSECCVNMRIMRVFLQL